MATVPALGTDTGAIFALSVFGAPLIARQLVAQTACPSGIAAALSVLTNPIRAAVQTANGCKNKRQTLVRWVVGWLFSGVANCGYRRVVYLLKVGEYFHIKVRKFIFQHTTFNSYIIYDTWVVHPILCPSHRKSSRCVTRKYCEWEKVVVVVVVLKFLSFTFVRLHVF